MEILVVDSNRSELRETESFLHAQYPEARIRAFDDGMEAVQYGYRHGVDRLFTELRMPRITGFDVARLLRKFHPETAVCIVTGTDAYVEQALREDFNGYYRKPLALEYGRTGNLLEKARGTPALRRSLIL